MTSLVSDHELGIQSLPSPPHNRNCCQKELQTTTLIQDSIQDNFLDNYKVNERKYTRKEALLSVKKACKSSFTRESWQTFPARSIK